MRYMLANLQITSERVTIGSMQHVLPILVAILVFSFIIWFANRKLNSSQQVKLFQFLGYFVSLTIVVFHTYKISQGNYSYSKDLPLYLCSFLALIIPIFTNYRKYWMFEILLFWIIAGTTQGVLTPDISVGYPSLDYFRYWIVHLGLLGIIMYAIFVFKMRPGFKSVFKSIIALQVYALLVFCLNTALNANYSYLNNKPKSASVLDYFGEWPYYIVVVQLLLIPLFLLIYLPFYLTRNKK